MSIAGISAACIQQSQNAAARTASAGRATMAQAVVITHTGPAMLMNPSRQSSQGHHHHHDLTQSGTATVTGTNIPIARA